MIVWALMVYKMYSLYTVFLPIDATGSDLNRYHVHELRYSKKCSQKILTALDPSLAKEPVSYEAFEF